MRSRLIRAMIVASAASGESRLVRSVIPPGWEAAQPPGRPRGHKQRRGVNRPAKGDAMISTAIRRVTAAAAVIVVACLVAAAAAVSAHGASQPQRRPIGVTTLAHF